MPKNDPATPDSGKSDLQAELDNLARATIWRNKIAEYEIGQYEPFVGHAEVHPQVGQKLLVTSPTRRFEGKIFDGAVFVPEDWYDRKAGKSWNDQGTHGPVLKYTARTIAADGEAIRNLGTYYLPFPEDDEVVYGHWYMPGHAQNAIGDILHVLELRNLRKNPLSQAEADKIAWKLKELHG